MKLTFDDLPESLRDVVELIGLAATLKLVEHFGGLIALYVPRDIEPEHPIAVAIGITAARKLAAHYGTDCLRNIPRCVAGLRRIRDAEIHRRHKIESAARLALAFGLTERQIWMILAEIRAGTDDKQSALF
ncbi:MAG TPA: Mor transcription activator family protein [Acidiferrobacterales bacterium]|nr:Mor transcription activator family protein [Acidiferrobacterales bacterium]